MGARVRYLKQDARTGALSYRRAFPLGLRPYIPGGPANELKRGLGSDKISDPQAFKAFALADAEYNQMHALALKASTATFDPLDDPTIAFLAETYRVNMLARDEAVRRKDIPRGPYDTRDHRVMSQDSWREIAANGTRAQILGVLGDDAEALAATQGLRVDPASPAFSRLCDKLLHATMGVADDVVARDRGQPVPTPLAPALGSQFPSQHRSPPAPAGDTLKEIIAKLLGRPSAPIAGTTLQVWRTASRSFTEINGPLPFAAVTGKERAAWLDALVLKPAKLPAHHRQLPLNELVELYPQGVQVSRIGVATRTAQVSAMRSIWTKAAQAGLISEDLRNPFANTRITALPGERSASEVNPGFTATDLTAIFNLPVFTQGERPTQGRGEAAFWMPLFLLWTGARPGEVAQLLVSDFSTDPETERLMVSFTDSGNHPEKGRRSLKTTKKGTGRRIFPVPQELMRIGLPAYLETLQRAGETVLFPKLTMVASRGLTAKWGEWWSRYLRTHGALPATGHKAARDFRHTWTTAARASGLGEREREYIQGHSPANSSANVGYGSRQVEGLAIARLEFKGLDLSRLKWAKDPL